MSTEKETIVGKYNLFIVSGNTKRNITNILAMVLLFLIILGSVLQGVCSDSLKLERTLGKEPMEVSLPAPREQAEYLFWNSEEQLAGYRNIDKIFDTRIVHADRRHRPIPKSDGILQVCYEVNGKNWTEETFMEINNVVGLLIIKDGEIVLERYRQNYTPNQRWLSFSVAKSITSTLVGAALKDGFIRSLQDPITEYLVKLKGSSYEGVTVQHLLTMTSGVEWNENYEDPNSDVAKIKSEPSIDGSDPIVSYLARLPRNATPGTKFNYNTGETHLVGSLLRSATGKNLSQYLSEKIWSPYGMELDANWMLDKAGKEQGGCCLSASLRDFARFGMFFMDGAIIDGVSIVPDNWINNATKPTKVSQNSKYFKESPFEGYGFMWWTLGNYSYEAVGIFGQLIHINPTLNLVIVIQSAWPKALTGIELQTSFIKAVETALTK